MTDFIDQQMVVIFTRKELSKLLMAVNNTLSELEETPDDWDYVDLDEDIEELGRLGMKLERLVGRAKND